MIKTCDVCGASLGFFKFRYAEGFICKKCYQIASRNHTETICQKSFAEISEICSHVKSEPLKDEVFEVTNKIGDFILIDKKNHKFCLPNNRRVTKKHMAPEIFSYESVDSYALLCSPPLSISELDSLEGDKSCEKVIHSMKVVIGLQNGTHKKEIDMISTPVRIKSYAFKQSYSFAKRIIKELKNISKS